MILIKLFDCLLSFLVLVDIDCPKDRHESFRFQPRSFKTELFSFFVGFVFDEHSYGVLISLFLDEKNNPFFKHP